MARQPRLKYEEMLRTVGAMLDEGGYQLAVLEVWPQGVVLQSTSRAGEAEGYQAERRELPLSEIVEASRQRTTLRGQGPAAEQTEPPLRFEWILRVIGAELDRQGQSRYQLTVSRESVTVEGAEGYRQIFGAARLTRLIRAAMRRRTPPPPEHT
ncbi:MAG TPA: hypothetical protein VFB73_06810 [Chloroflexota bacterium]|nr:hypothetical protein [Chloroflexota bacterium]HZU05666.1 hypothetical protein [Chloroflexota bacterium]